MFILNKYLNMYQSFWLKFNNVQATLDQPTKRQSIKVKNKNGIKMNLKKIMNPWKAKVFLSTLK